MGKPDAPMTIVDHLNELRRRLMIVLVVLVLASIASFTYAKQILDILTMGRTLIFIRPSEAFLAHVRVAVSTGSTIAMPVVFYHVLAFLVPAFSKREKRIIVGSVFLMFLLFIAGLSFAWYVVFPIAMKFFASFSSEQLLPLYNVSDYLSFATGFLLAFGLVFQLPVLFWALGALHIVSARFLRASRKYALVLIVIIAALITPPDVVSQVLMALPMLFLYEFGIILVALTERGRRKRKEESAGLSN